MFKRLAALIIILAAFGANNYIVPGPGITVCVAHADGSIVCKPYEPPPPKPGPIMPIPELE